MASPEVEAQLSLRLDSRQRNLTQPVWRGWGGEVRPNWESEDGFTLNQPWSSDSYKGRGHSNFLIKCILLLNMTV